MTLKQFREFAESLCLKLVRIVLASKRGWIERDVHGPNRELNGLGMCVVIGIGPRAHPLLRSICHVDRI